MAPHKERLISGAPRVSCRRRPARSVPPREDEGRGAGGARKVVPAGLSRSARAPPGGAGPGRGVPTPRQGKPKG